jgi:multidrug efflux pump subunit AcrA (membrane-fusion protein)
MIPMDPRKAQKLGENWGGAITDSVFGIVDVVKNAPAQKAANNRAALAKNAQIEANNAVTRMNNQLRVQAMQEIAAEQEAMAMARMTPAQREAYKKSKADAAKNAARADRLAREASEERWQIFWVCVILFVLLPAVIYVGLFIYGVIASGTDWATYHSLAKIVPGLKVFVGR